MFKTEGLQIEGQLPVMDLPLFREMKKFPFPAAPAAAVIVPVPLFPARMFLDRKSVV